MPRLQDKICDGLTFVGLLGVIGFGLWSVWPEAQAAPEQSLSPPEAPTEQLPLDTLQEVPLYEEQTAPAAVASDTLAVDTLGVEFADTAELVPSASKVHDDAPMLGTEKAAASDAPAAAKRATDSQKTDNAPRGR